MTRTESPVETVAQTLLVVRLNRGVNLLAGRDDLIASVKWDADADEPPAWFTHARGEVTLNGPVALDGADPAEINPLTPDGRRRHPVLVGLLCHEAGHAHSTHWDEGFGEEVPVVVVRAAVLLEEPRIEHRQLQRRPGDRLFLRAASQRIILPGATTASAAATRWQAAQAALLTAGRVDAGVLDTAEVRKVLTLCRKTLGRRDFNRLCAVWREALAVADGDVPGLVDLAARWVEIVGVDDPADAPAPACARGVPDGIPAGGGDGEPEEDEGAGDDTGDAPSIDPGEQDGGALAEALAGAFRDAMTVVAERGSAQATAELREDEDRAPAENTSLRDRHTEEREAKEREAKEREAAEEQAELVFHGYSADGATDPRAATRPPTDEERTLARRTGKALRRAQLRERARIVTTSQVPPGRLMGREAMLAAAQRARSAPVTARPFRQVTRRDTPEPPLTVGIAVDISGSMTWATETMASVAWLVAHAVDQVGGSSATVAFGEEVTAITWPGVTPVKVQTFIADDGCEVFTDAMRALDGGLRLTSGDGARLVFVVSDGHFVAPGEKKRAAAMVERLVEHGVVMLWLDLHRDGRLSGTIVPSGAVPIPVVDVADIPQQVETILVRALRAR
ncbi:hypothetical protein [Actinokineospora cianjurensis]|uniref:VWA domain containing CoxE-like protein n=1 Tax=Actinokineospora cianjurensis TaxID=585224 RepID=A0A421B285_9PSEU|nr:hypothetical protein [Actinokineospora cianjurensis]RLK58462.1 hypothetical protein CLV68_4568 [Actinokineospora cianjurensis]